MSCAFTYYESDDAFRARILGAWPLCDGAPAPVIGEPPNSWSHNFALIAHGESLDYVGKALGQARVQNRVEPPSAHGALVRQEHDPRCGHWGELACTCGLTGREYRRPWGGTRGEWRALIEEHKAVHQDVDDVCVQLARPAVEARLAFALFKARLQQEALEVSEQMWVERNERASQMQHVLDIMWTKTKPKERGECEAQAKALLLAMVWR